MPNLIHKAKLAWVAATVATVVLAGSVATVSAARPDPSQGNGGYAVDQCANGKWKTFKNPDGSQKFKNQGQCVAFFATQNAGNNFPGANNFPGFSQIISAVLNAVQHFLASFF